MKTLDRNLYKLTAEDIMSNFDHIIEDGAEELLKSNKIYGEYPAWNFHGAVWFEDGKFYCEIWQRHNHVNTVEASTLQEIMETCSCRYGQG
jgi:hypothetical protein